MMRTGTKRVFESSPESLLLQEAAKKAKFTKGGGGVLRTVSKGWNATASTLPSALLGLRPELDIIEDEEGELTCCDVAARMGPDAVKEHAELHAEED